MWGSEGPHDLLQGVPPMVGAGFQPEKAVSALVSPWSLLGFGLNRLVISSSWFPVYYLLVITLVKTVAGGN